jgi:hypothetical protein
MVAFVKDSSTQARQPKQAERHTASERERESREREREHFFCKKVPSIFRYICFFKQYA